MAAPNVIGEFVLPAFRKCEGLISETKGMGAQLDCQSPSLQGVQYEGDESTVIHRFKELEDRDTKLLRQFCCEREDML